MNGKVETNSENYARLMAPQTNVLTLNTKD